MPRSPDEALADFCPGLPFAVALSGGADSTALLIACAERWPGQVRAVHVHHGLQAAADGFEDFCRQLCERLQVPLRVQRVDARAQPGQSPEDAARQARYRALAEAVDHPDQHLTRSTIAGLAALLAEGKGSQPGLILYGPLAEDAL